MRVTILFAATPDPSLAVVHLQGQQPPLSCASACTVTATDFGCTILQQDQGDAAAQAILSFSHVCQDMAQALGHGMMAASARWLQDTQAEVLLPVKVCDASKAHLGIDASIQQCETQTCRGFSRQ